MQASEALQLSLKCQKSLNEVISSIKAMANAGKRYAAFEEYLISENTINELHKLDYHVVIPHDTVKVEW